MSVGGGGTLPPASPVFFSSLSAAGRLHTSKFSPASFENCHRSSSLVNCQRSSSLVKRLLSTKAN